LKANREESRRPFPREAGGNKVNGTFTSRKVLITGGLGFIGSSLARRLMDLGAHVTLVDSLIICAVTSRFGVNTRDTSPYELRRVGPWEHDLPTFALKLAWDRLGWA
jgi:hypothetical protein